MWRDSVRQKVPLQPRRGWPLTAWAGMLALLGLLAWLLGFGDDGPRVWVLVPLGVLLCGAVGAAVAGRLRRDG